MPLARRALAVRRVEAQAAPFAALIRRQTELIRRPPPVPPEREGDAAPRPTAAGLEEGRESRIGIDPNVDPLDPETRRCAQLASPLAPGGTPSAGAIEAPPAGDAVAPRARVSMEELLPELVRRIAWAGDRRRGSVQLELGAGPHAGTTITVHADDGKVRVELDGGGAAALRARIRARLERQGLNVESVT